MKPISFYGQSIHQEEELISQTPEIGLGNNQYMIEQMSKELKSKDQIIQNLRERLIALEGKVGEIRREEERDKSQ